VTILLCFSFPYWYAFFSLLVLCFGGKSLPPGDGCLYNSALGCTTYRLFIHSLRRARGGAGVWRRDGHALQYAAETVPTETVPTAAAAAVPTAAAAAAAAAPDAIPVDDAPDARPLLMTRAADGCRGGGGVLRLLLLLMLPLLLLPLLREQLLRRLLERLLQRLLEQLLERSLLLLLPLPPLPLPLPLLHVNLRHHASHDAARRCDPGVPDALHGGCGGRRRYSRRC
jgi:hypothetical protein